MTTDTLPVHLPASPPEFNGADYVPARDRARLATQLETVKQAMQGAGPLTLAEISRRAGAPPASTSAQIRHLRKERFGGHTIRRIHLGHGLYSYELIA